VQATLIQIVNFSFGSTACATNVDIMLFGVEYLAVPRHLRCVHLDRPPERECVEISKLLDGSLRPASTFAIPEAAGRSSGRRRTSGSSSAVTAALELDATNSAGKPIVACLAMTSTSTIGAAAYSPTLTTVATSAATRRPPSPARARTPASSEASVPV
jgi:hypothetical protein